jgi:hypothetical protein
LGDEDYSPSAANALKTRYGFAIAYQRDCGVYGLTDFGALALLNLPTECVEALGFLDASFPARRTLPEHPHIGERVAIRRPDSQLPNVNDLLLQVENRAVARSVWCSVAASLTSRAKGLLADRLCLAKRHYRPVISLRDRGTIKAILAEQSP